MEDTTRLGRSWAIKSCIFFALTLSPDKVSVACLTFRWWSDRLKSPGSISRSSQFSSCCFWCSFHKFQAEHTPVWFGKRPHEGQRCRLWSQWGMLWVNREPGIDNKTLYLSNMSIITNHRKESCPIGFMKFSGMYVTPFFPGILQGELKSQVSSSYDIGKWWGQP